MRQVFKYPVPFPCDDFTMALPRGAEVLTVGIQHGELQLWALVDTGEILENRSFRVAGTGHAIYEPATRYISTIFIQRGDLVFHFFEILPRRIM